MNTVHLSETEIQQFVLEPSKTGISLQQHISQCRQCQARAVNYRIVFESIVEQDLPVFDFDLSALVMEQLVVPKKQTQWFMACFYTLILLFISALGLIGYVNWTYLIVLTTDVSPAIVAMLGMAALFLVFFQVWITHQKHQEQMHVLDGF